MKTSKNLLSLIVLLLFTPGTLYGNSADSEYSTDPTYTSGFTKIFIPDQKKKPKPSLDSTVSLCSDARSDHETRRGDSIQRLIDEWLEITCSALYFQEQPDKAFALQACAIDMLLHSLNCSADQLPDLSVMPPWFFSLSYGFMHNCRETGRDWKQFMRETLKDNADYTISCMEHYFSNNNPKVVFLFR